MADLEAVKKTIEEAVATNNGKMDLLIACAGETRPERFDEVILLPALHCISLIILFKVDPKYFKRLMEINYLGAVYSILAVLPFMKSQKRGRYALLSYVLLSKHVY